MCANIDDGALSAYVRHGRSLLSKQHSKNNRKDPLLSAAAIDDLVIVGDPSSVVLPLVLLNLPSVAPEINSLTPSRYFTK